MPLFYFHQRSGEGYIPDPEGCDHRDIGAARLEAIHGARCILAEGVRAGVIDLDQRFDVHDADGRHVLTVGFAEAVDLIVPSQRRSRSRLRQVRQA